MKKFSIKKLLIIALAITLFTFVRHGSWSTGYVAGEGWGFPWYFWRVTTSTDMIGYIGEGDKQLAYILGGISFVGDIIVWFLLLLTIRSVYRKVSK